MYAITLIASKFVLCLYLLFSKCGDPGFMKVQEVGKSKAQKAQWDLGTKLGVFGTVETSCLSSQVMALYNPSNECIKLHFILN